MQVGVGIAREGGALRAASIAEQPLMPPSSGPNKPTATAASQSIGRRNITAIATSTAPHTAPRVGIDGVGQPGVGRPRPPERGEDQETVPEPTSRRIIRQNGRDRREREDEDEVEEELERR
jgi:hypothetical protein